MWHLLRQSARCIVCGEALFPEIPPPKRGSVTREHKVPRVHGGSNSMSNIGASHHECNRSRNDRMTLRRLRPDVGSGQRQGHKWRAQLVTQSPVCGLWWTQRSIRTLNNTRSHSAGGSRDG